MPTLSASDYTQYLKFKAAAASPIRQAIQTRDNATLSQSVVNANVLASQAAFVVTPSIQVVGDLSRVQGVQPRRTNNPSALSTLSFSPASVFQRAGGLPANNRVGTYTRLPQIV